MTHIIFDLDNTLVNTSRLRPYMGTRAGREYVVQNVLYLNTALCHPALEELVDVCDKFGDTISIVTNSPQDYARALLQKHRILNNARIYGNAHKPSSTYLEIAVQDSGVPKKETVVIGDSATDILAAHDAKITSIAAAWGYSSQEQLELAEPQEIVTDPSLLLDAVTRFEAGEFKFAPRSNPDDFSFLPVSEFEAADPDFSHAFLDSYQPWSGGSQAFTDFSSRVLRFKSAKDISLEEIKNNACDQYFAGGSLRRGHTYKNVLVNFIVQIRGLLEKMDLDGNVLFVAAPNSFPEFCYKTDINQFFLHNVVKDHPVHELSRERVLSRVFPKQEAHILGARSKQGHYRTIGLRNNELEELASYDSAVLFDDVFTSGAQIKCLAKILRYFDFAGGFHSITLGKNRE